MSESFEEEMKRKEEEARKYIAKRKKGVREISVEVNTSGIEQLISRIKDLEPNSKAFDDLKQSLVRKCEREGLTVDSSKIKTAEDFRDTIQKMYDAEEKGSGIPIRVEKRGGSGQIPLSQQSRGGSRSFDSVDEMIDDLRVRASAKTKEGEECQSILDELFRKAFKGQTETKLAFKEPEIKGKILRGGREEGIIEKMNEQFRKKRKMRKQHEEREK